MNLFSGLEKFGFSGKEDLNILGEDNKEKKPQVTEKKQQVRAVPEEKDFLIPKTIKCPICDRDFTSLHLKSGKLKRLEPDFDLRPNYLGVDTIKYDVTACPYCGYAAMNRYFEGISIAQMKLIRQEVGAKFRPTKPEENDTYSYEQALDRFKLSMVCTMTKKAKLSEKAYTCLKIAWLEREMLKTMPEKTQLEKEEKAALKQEYDVFYRQAYEGFVKVSATEAPPFCGMDVNTLDFMLANMAYHHKEYDVASKYVFRLLGNKNTSARVKDRCLDLKEKIVAKKKEEG